MMSGILEAGFALFLLFGSLTCAQPSPSVRVPLSSFCPPLSLQDSFFGFRDSVCPLNGFDFSGVIEGDEISLQRALGMVHWNSQDYFAVLFYASWCPFSVTFRPSFSVLSSLYPLIPHFAIEESSIRPRFGSKYAVYNWGFPVYYMTPNSNVANMYASYYQNMGYMDFPLSFY